MPTMPTQNEAARRRLWGFAVALALVSALAIVTMPQRRVVMVQGFPQSDLDMLKVMQSMEPKKQVEEKKGGGVQTQQMAAKKGVKGEKRGGLTMPQQYARIMQNQGYFSPWSRQNTWNNRIAINNIRKANTPEALEKKAEQIKKENERFARKFSTPHTSMYTGVHESIDKILDPKYQPWGNTGPRKAYYQGY